uniref:WW domain-containing protein n=1 Tax=Alexandrium catenella TaxID=2925 RepID=A0A7S1WCK8_ALECA
MAMGAEQVQVWVVLPVDGQHRQYYWNTATDETKWDKPCGERVDLWNSTRSDRGTCYWNATTRKVTWDIPRASTLRRPTPLPLEWGNPSASSRAPPSTSRFTIVHEGSTVPDEPGTRERGEQADAVQAAPGNPEDSQPSDTDARWLETDSAVRICGLQRSANQRWNNQTGKVLDHFHGRVIVKLPELLGGTMLAMWPRNLSPLQKGDIVVLRNLSQEELNGQVATVEDTTEIRVNVKLRNGSLKSVKPKRLEPLARLWSINLRPTYERLQRSKEQTCLFIDSHGKHRRFCLHLPLDFSMPTKEGGKFARPYPLLVFMHGGAKGSFFTRGSYSLKTPGLMYAASKFIVVSPKCEWTWKDVPKPWVNEMVDSLRAAAWVDDRRIYLSGCSMGGMSTWEIAASRPDLYAAIAPVAAHHQAERERWIAASLMRTPIFVAHSENDDTCLMQKEECLWRLLQDNPRFVVNMAPNVDHCSMYERAYCDECVLYDWLFKFEKPLEI